MQRDPDLFRIDARTDIDSLWQPDTALLYGLDDVWGIVNPLTLPYYAASWEAPGSRSSDLYALFNVKYVLGRKDVVLDQAVWQLAYDGDPDLNVYVNRHFQPRLHLMGQARSVPDLAAAQQAVISPDFQSLQEVILEGGQSPDWPGRDGAGDSVGNQSNQGEHLRGRTGGPTGEPDLVSGLGGQRGRWSMAAGVTSRWCLAGGAGAGRTARRALAFSLARVIGRPDRRPGHTAGCGRWVCLAAVGGAGKNEAPRRRGASGKMRSGKRFEVQSVLM